MVVICPILVLKVCVSSLREGMIFAYDRTSGLREDTNFVYPTGIVPGVWYICVSLVMFVSYDGNNCLFVSVLYISTMP